MKINPHIRQLPAGYEPSKEAVELAKKYGLHLKEGETFVRSFDKPVYVSKIKK